MCACGACGIFCAVSYCVCVCSRACIVLCAFFGVWSALCAVSCVVYRLGQKNEPHINFSKRLLVGAPKESV